MTKCPICNRPKIDDLGSWCKSCHNNCPEEYDEVAEWAANRARKFEKDMTRVLVKALEEIVNMERANKSCDSGGYFYYCVEVAQEALAEYEKDK